MANQVIELSSRDRRTFEKIAKYVKFFSFIYIILWIILCLILFSLIWVIFNN